MSLLSHDEVDVFYGSLMEGDGPVGVVVAYRSRDEELRGSFA
jgi:hypothetical protein